MKLCLLTYDTPHLKTAQAFHLLRQARHDLSFMVMPFTPRPKRDVRFAHRPEQFVGVGAAQLAAACDLDIWRSEDWQAHLADADYFVVCGSNLIEPGFANTGKILNIHSGLIPTVRGLDSFKWAIVNMAPMGNTLHVVDDQVDAGRIIAHKRTPLYSTDTIESFAARHYDAEIAIFGELQALLGGGTVEDLPPGAPNKRMPRAVEENLETAFEAYRVQYALDLSTSAIRSGL
jgi:phosphoribosylglycinamide formyltransferase-1